MQNDKFEELFLKINKIVELIDKIPSEFRSEVFQTLFDAAKEGNIQDMYREEILKLSEHRQSLKEFISVKRPVSNIERSLLFVFYLEELGVRNITAKHISACYEISELNPPGNLMQNLRDACSARYAYLTSEQNYFHTTQKGKEFCTN